MNPLLWKLYCRALTLLPPAFRCQYAMQMLQTARDFSADHPSSLWNSFSLFADLAITTLRENTHMLLSRISRRPFFYQALCLSAVAFVIALGGYVVMQQTIRRAANHPQREMALDAAAALERGADPANIAALRGIDFARSLEPFLTIYDEQGHVISSQASFAAGVPAPPAGVLLNARHYGSNELTWQPRHDIRLATVTIYYAGPRPGYVMAARSLWTAEQGELIARFAATFGWVGIVALLMLSAAIFNRIQRRHQPA